MIGSKSWNITLDECWVWLLKQRPFFAAYAVVFLTAIQQGKTFEEALVVLKLYTLNAVVSFLMTISKDTRGIYP